MGHISMFIISHTDCISLFSLVLVKYLNLGHFKGRGGLVCSPLETEMQMSLGCLYEDSPGCITSWLTVSWLDACNWEEVTQ